MKRKTIDTMREVRLWAVQVVVPLVGISMAIPELRDPIIDKYKHVKERVQKKFNKK